MTDLGWTHNHLALVQWLLMGGRDERLELLEAYLLRRYSREDGP